MLFVFIPSFAHFKINKMKTSSKKAFFYSDLSDKPKYSLLSKLPITFITPINCGGKPDHPDYDPLTDDITSPFRYNNTSQLLCGKVRRNEAYHSSAMLKQRSIIDLSDLCVVSKIHLLGLPGATVFNLYVSEEPHHKYKKVATKQVAYHHQNLRVIDVGSLPARFLMVEVVNGEPLPNDPSCVEVYGLSHRKMTHLMGPDETKVMFDKTFKIIYGFK